MLVSVDDPTRPITRIPHEREFKQWTKRLTPGEYDSIIKEIDCKIDSGEVHTSSWMPGGNWAGTPFENIYEIACMENPAAAAECFGIFVWVVMMKRSEKWSFGRYENDGMPIK